MTIKEVSEHFGISQDTLRYYERVKMIPKVTRTAGGIRDYQEQDLKWVELALCMRSAGLPIEVMIEYLDLYQKGDETIPARLELLLNQMEVLQEQKKQLETTMNRYKSITEDDLRANYKYFLDGILPTCEECGVKMAVHPDDPAWPIFGLPRIAHSQADFDKIVALHDSPCNTLCLCTGSLGSDPANDLPAIIRHFGAMDRIGCLHVRNVKHLGHHKFREAAHLSSTGDLDLFAIMKAVYDTCPDTYIRPDHGRMIWDEVGRPGYGLYDRALGAVYLNGLWEAICKMSQEEQA